MRLIKIIFVAALLCAYAGGIRAEGVKEFIGKAQIIEKTLRVKEIRYGVYKKKYNAWLIQINKLKTSGNTDFFTEVKLAYALNAGNKLGYKVFLLEKEIKEQKDDYFTYATLIIEDCNKDFMECLKTKCPELKEKYSAREKWLTLIQDYSDLVKMEKMIEVYAESSGADAEQDFSAYLDRKTIQTEERIYIMKEEKNIRTAAKKAGLEIKAEEFTGIEAGIKELEKTAAEIHKIREKVKMKRPVDKR